MAEINPQMPADSGGNFLGYSRGQQPDTSIAGLFQDATGFMNAGVTALQNIITGNIRRDVTQAADAVRDNEINVMGGITSTVPAEIEEYRRNTAALRQSRNAGVLPDVHYWAQLDVETRRIRQKYPGHRHVVDQIMQEVVGVNPANRLVNELHQTRAGARTAEERNQEYWEHQAGSLGIPAVRNGQPRHWRELQADVTNVNAITRRQQAEAARLTQQRARGQVTTDAAERDAHATFDQQWAQLMNNVTQSIPNFWERLDQIRRNPNSVTQQQVDEIAGVYNSLIRGRGQQLIDQILHTSTPGNDTLATLIGDAQRIDNIRQSWNRRIDEMGDAIVNRQWGYFQRLQENLQAIQRRDVITALNDPVHGRTFRNIQTAREIYGPGLYQNSGIFSIAPQLQQGLREIFRQGHEAGIVIPYPLSQTTIQDNVIVGDPQQRAELAGARIRANVADLSNPQAPDEVVRRVGTILFGRGNLNYLQDHVRNMPEVYQMFIGDARLHANMQRLRTTDANLYQQYEQWVIHNFGVATRQIAQNLGTGMTDPSARNLAFNPATNTFVFNDPENRNPGTQQTVNQLNRILQSYAAFEVARGTAPEMIPGRIEERMRLLNLDTRTTPGTSGFTRFMDAIRGFSTSGPVSQTILPGLRQRATGDYADLLNLIHSGESGRHGYLEVFGGPDRNRPITEMTLAEVRAFQDEMVRQGRFSSAVGRYQFIRPTFDNVVRRLGLDPNTTRFTPEIQDRMAIELANQRGLQEYLRNPTPEAETRLVNALASEWAALQQADGTGRYDRDGVNRATVSAQRIREVLRRMVQQRGVTANPQ